MIFIKDIKNKQRNEKKKGTFSKESNILDASKCNGKVRNTNN